MADSIDAAIGDIVREINDRMRIANELCRLKGLPPVYPDAAGGASQIGGIRPDQYYMKPLATAAREYLESRHAAGRGAASVDEIYNALLTGGFKFEQKAEEYAKPALRQSLTKNTAIFHRVSEGVYGLSSWYDLPRNGQSDDNGAARRRQKPPTKKKAKLVPKSAPGEATVKSQPAPEEPAKPAQVTLVQAIKNAVGGLKGAQFTKMDVLNWIDKHYPALKATERKVTLFSQIAHMKDELGIKTVKEGMGKAPAIFMVEDYFQ